MRPLLFFDFETGGLDAKKNPILSMGYIVDIGGVEQESGIVYMRPFPHQKIESEALRVNGFTEEQTATFPEPTEALQKLCGGLAAYVDCYTPETRLLPVGFNSHFDFSFLMEWHIRSGLGRQGIFSYVHSFHLDVRQIYCMLFAHREAELTQRRTLAALCEEYSIRLENAHDALADVRATRELFYTLAEAKTESKENEETAENKKLTGLLEKFSNSGG